MSNRIERPRANEEHILRNIPANAYSGNSATASIAMFTPNRRGYQTQTGPAPRFVDMQYDVVMANPPYKPILKNSPNEQLKKSFRLYADKWYAETGRDSSISRMTSNVNYLKVIKLGPDVVPLILRELQSDPAPWFLALRVLTENFDVGSNHAGNFEKIAEDWISWGKDRGLI